MKYWLKNFHREIRFPVHGIIHKGWWQLWWRGALPIATDQLQKKNYLSDQWWPGDCEVSRGIQWRPERQVDSRWIVFSFMSYPEVQDNVRDIPPLGYYHASDGNILFKVALY